MGTSLEGDIIQPSNSSLLIDNGRRVVDILALLSAGWQNSEPPIDNEETEMLPWPAAQPY